MKIAIVEDHSLIADLLVALCTRELKYEVVLIETHGLRALPKLRELKPDLLLLDLSLPDVDGLEVAKVVLQELPQTRVLVLSSLRDPVALLRVRESGVHGFVDKRDQTREVLADAIRLVSRGHGFFTQVVNDAAASIRRDANAFNRILSDYEQRVLSLIGEALSDAEIAAQLGVTASTIQSRRRDIMSKLDIHTTPKLIRFAIMNGFTRTENFRPNDPDIASGASLGAKVPPPAPAAPRRRG